MRRLLSFLFIAAVLTALSSCRKEILFTEGSSVVEYACHGPFEGKSVKVFYHIPSGEISSMPVLFVMHGMDRNGDEYRDQWVEQADKYGFIVLVPTFSSEQFPDEFYQRGNVTSENGSYNPENERVYVLIEEVFNYNACTMNKVHLLSTEMIDCSDKEIVLLGNSVSFSMEKGFTPDFDIYVITKASENPNAGKTVLELYSTYGVEETIAEAITRFNETNDSFFVEVTDRYEFDSVKTYLSADSKDDEALDSLKENLSLNDKLAMDIMNGTGPDILINTGDMGRLYNSNYLVDLSKYFADLDSEKYFTNIIEAAKTDGKLYQLPIRFDIEGIHTDSKYAGASGMGFTTKEYEDFLYGPLNGYDLNQTGQAFYFATLFNAMSDKFIVNGKVDFSGPEFAELADFVKDNVHEKALSNEAEMSDERSWQNDRIARLTSYSVNDLQGANAILGIPSSDGRGPMVRCNISAAVSTQSVNIDACVEFTKILLSDDIQYDMSKKGFFSLSREAYRKAGSIILDYCNGPRGSMAFQKITVTGQKINRTTDFTEADLNNLEKIISSCTHFDSADASINMILIEEMPAYFLGQKDLDSVIRIAQDRAQKVLDER